MTSGSQIRAAPGWPDINVAAIMVALAVQGAVTVVRQSFYEVLFAVVTRPLKCCPAFARKHPPSTNNSALPISRKRSIAPRPSKRGRASDGACARIQYSRKARSATNLVVSAKSPVLSILLHLLLLVLERA